MKAATLARLGGWLAGVWAGLMAGLGFVAAPLLFSGLQLTDAGRLAGRLFALDATIGLCVGALLVMVGLQLGRQRFEQGAGSRFGRELVLALAALFCVVIGYYALQPMMETARTGATGGLSFATLHGVSAAFFVLRLALVAVLAWACTSPPAPGLSRPVPSS